MQIEYFAGLFDGEGSISLLGQGKDRCRRPVLSLDMSDDRPLDELHLSFGGFRPKPQSRSERLTMYRWRMNGFPALDLLEDLLPHLKIDRRIQIAKLLVSDEVLRQPRVRGPKQHKIEHVEKLFTEVQRLNAIRRTSIPRIPSTTPTAGDVQYLAGILDGEGHINKHKQAEVWSTDPELPAWLKSRFGGGCYAGKSAWGNQRGTWRWVSSMRDSRWREAAAHMLLLDKADRIV